MYYVAIKPHDVANGPGVRVSLFVSGCTHHCKNCFNKVAWDFHYGTPFTEEVMDELIALLKRPFIDGLSLLGGEPFELENQKGLLPFMRRVKEECPDKSVWAYSGYLFDKQLLKQAETEEVTKELLTYIDVLVDGKFVEELKSPKLNFRGSSNQRIIKVPESLKANKVILHEKNNIVEERVKV